MGSTQLVRELIRGAEDVEVDDVGVAGAVDDVDHMRALDRGEVFVVTRNGIPVGELRPARRRFVSREVLLAAFASAPHIDAQRFRDELDAVLDQSPEPRA